MSAVERETGYQRERKCLRKRGWWKTKKAAHKRANEIYKQRGIRLYPYLCGVCGTVHLTKSRSVKGKGVI